MLFGNSANITMLLCYIPMPVSLNPFFVVETSILAGYISSSGCTVRVYWWLKYPILPSEIWFSKGLGERPDFDWWNSDVDVVWLVTFSYEKVAASSCSCVVSGSSTGTKKNRAHWAHRTHRTEAKKGAACDLGQPCVLEMGCFRIPTNLWKSCFIPPKKYVEKKNHMISLGHGCFQLVGYMWTNMWVPIYLMPPNGQKYTHDIFRDFVRNCIRQS